MNIGTIAGVEPADCPAMLLRMANSMAKAHAAPSMDGLDHRHAKRLLLAAVMLEGDDLERELAQRLVDYHVAVLRGDLEAAEHTAGDMSKTLEDYAGHFHNLARDYEEQQPDWAA